MNPSPKAARRISSMAAASTGGTVIFRIVKKSITEAFLRLLKQKSISRITVSEIIKDAGVARASFYRNYSSKGNVIPTLISDILEEFRASMDSGGPTFYTRHNILMGFTFFSRYE